MLSELQSNTLQPNTWQPDALQSMPDSESVLSLQGVTLTAHLGASRSARCAISISAWRADAYWA